MRYSEKLSKVVIEQIDNYESAKKVLDEIEKKVMTTIGDFVQKHLEDFELEEKSNFDFYDNGQIKFCFKDWGKKKRRLAEFSIYWNGSDEDVEVNWLTVICGRLSVDNQLTFGFNIDFREIEHLDARKYKASLKKAFLSTTLPENKFVLSSDGQSIEYSFSLSLEDIKDCYPSDLDDAMEPIEELMNIFKENVESFENLYKEIAER